MERLPESEFEGEPVNRLAAQIQALNLPSWSISSGVVDHPPLEAESSVADLMYLYQKVPKRSPESAEAMVEMARKLTEEWGEMLPSELSAELREEVGPTLARMVQGWIRLRYPKAALHLAEWYVGKFADPDGVMAPLIERAREALREEGEV